MPRDPLNPTGTAHPDLLDLELAEPRTEPLGRPPAATPEDSPRHRPSGPVAAAFDPPRQHAGQPIDQLDEETAAFVSRMDMAFVATADAAGECEATLRTGPPGFLQVLDRRRIAYPDSGDDLGGNARVGIMIVGAGREPIGLQLSGRATVVPDADLRAERPGLPATLHGDRVPERWVVVELEQAYLHGRTRQPQPPRRPRPVPPGLRPKGGDHFAGQIPIGSASAGSGR